jgi:hypothetical protein
MMGRKDFEAILADVEYGDWAIDVVALAEQHAYCEDHRTSHMVETALALRVRFLDNAETQTGRKWYLSPHMTRSEVVLTALKAILTAEEHEARERFRYKGRRIAGPHINVDFLVATTGLKENLDLRDPADTAADVL